jgi:hypothetical protein
LTLPRTTASTQGARNHIWKIFASVVDLIIAAEAKLVRRETFLKKVLKTAGYLTINFSSTFLCWDDGEGDTNLDYAYRINKSNPVPMGPTRD